MPTTQTDKSVPTNDHGHDDAADRMARDERPLPDDVTECRFCAAGRDALHNVSHTKNVAQHSHEGRKIERLGCDECGGALVVESIVQSRINLPSNPTVVARWWQIPESHVLSTCAGCGEVAGTHELVEDNRALFDAMVAGDMTTTCCDAAGELHTGRFDVLGGER